MWNTQKIRRLRLMSNNIAGKAYIYIIYKNIYIYIYLHSIYIYIYYVNTYIYILCTYTYIKLSRLLDGNNGIIYIYYELIKLPKAHIVGFGLPRVSRVPVYWGTKWGAPLKPASELWGSIKGPTEISSVMTTIWYWGV